MFLGIVAAIVGLATALISLACASRETIPDLRATYFYGAMVGFLCAAAGFALIIFR